MPTRRTSPRRFATRPTAVYERVAEDLEDEADEPGLLRTAAPWLSLLALVLAAGAIGYLIVNRGGSDLGACRSAAWGAVPEANDLPDGWTLGSTDLNANGMTVSIMGPVPADGSSSQPVVYASVTCYGDVARTALDQNREAAKAAGATLTDRSDSGDAYDVDNPTTGSVTTLFRVGGLIGQVADSGTATPTDLAAITTAVAAAMGDKTAAGTSDAGTAAGSDEPPGSGAVGSDEPSPSAFAPELEALLPKELGGASLTIDSGPASSYFAQDPTSRALGARLRELGKTLDDLQVAQAYDESGQVTDSIAGFRLPGAAPGALRSLILDTWLGAGNAGVKQSSVTIGGKPFTKIDYGDQQTNEYVYAKADSVIVIDTSDETIVAEVAKSLK